MKFHLPSCPILRHQLRWFFRARMWLCLAAVPLIAGIPFCTAIIPVVLARFALTFLLGIMIMLLLSGVAATRRKPGLDPAIGTPWPRWRIVWEQSLPFYLLGLPVWLLLCPLHFCLAALPLACLAIQTMLMLTVATGNSGWGLPLMLCIVVGIWDFITVSTMQALAPAALVLLILVLLTHYSLLRPPAANHALLLRPPLLIGAGICMISGIPLQTATPAAILSTAGIILILAAALERLQPSRRQLYFLRQHPDWKWPLFPFQSGFLPGLLTGLACQSLQSADFWQHGIWQILPLPLMLLAVRYYFRRIPTVAAVCLTIAVWFVLTALALEGWNCGWILRYLTGLTALLLLPACRTYIKCYITGDLSYDKR